MYNQLNKNQFNQDFEPFWNIILLHLVLDLPHVITRNITKRLSIVACEGQNNDNNKASTIFLENAFHTLH
jgi:hypothetical protein